MKRNTILALCAGEKFWLRPGGGGGWMSPAKYEGSGLVITAEGCNIKPGGGEGLSTETGG